MTLGPEEIEASLQDISPQGLGVISPVAFARDLKIPIVVFTAAGSVAVEAEVRYCRRMAEQPESFRIGLRIGELDRVGKARWNTMLRR